MAGALVIVDSVVIVNGCLGFYNYAAALPIACFGGGSVLWARTLPEICAAINPWHAMRERKMRRYPRHLTLAQQKQLTHHGILPDTVNHISN